MRTQPRWSLGIIIPFLCLAVIGCAGAKRYDMTSIPAGSNGTEVVKTDAFMEEGHFMGLSASRQSDSLAKMVVATNNNSQYEFAKIERLEVEDMAVDSETLRVAGVNVELSSKGLANSETALTYLKEFDRLAKLQGTGEITLFFATNSHVISRGSENHTRLVRFLDDVAMKANGRTVKFLLIGSASATGVAKYNAKLSDKRAAAPAIVIDEYLLNVPHELLRVYGVGDSLSPKGAKGTQKYQNVRILAVYDEAQLPKVPGVK